MQASQPSHCIINFCCCLPADEPSSGLDSFQAEQVMQTLKDLASDGHTVVSSSGRQQDTLLQKD